jgi:acetyl esterase/lipase
MQKSFLFLLFLMFLLPCESGSAPVYKNPQNYDLYKSSITFARNISYSAQYPDSMLDIIYTQTSNKKDKTIFWVHGGSYIEGDKEKVEPYMVMLANNGYTVINLNYALAPKNRYPVQLKQIELAYTFIKERGKDYGVNLDKVYFGGDSSGAQLVSQFANLQTNGGYLKEINANIKDIQLNKVIERDNLSGVLLFCGLYNFRELLVFNPRIIKLGKLYFGTKDTNNINIDLCGIIDKITSGYPPVFITDGNTGSFLWQAKDFEQALKEKGVKVKSVFYNIYSKDDPVLQHQYQFDMDNEYSKKTFQELLSFLQTAD